MVRKISEVKKIVKEAIKLVNEHYPVRRAYLFGSYAKGNPHEYSDIDVAIFADGLESIKIDKKLNFIVAIEMKIGSGIELHLFSSKLLKEARPTNFYGYILSTGMKIAA